MKICFKSGLIGSKWNTSLAYYATLCPYKYTFNVIQLSFGECAQERDIHNNFVMSVEQLSIEKLCKEHNFSYKSCMSQEKKLMH